MRKIKNGKIAGLIASPVSICWRFVLFFVVCLTSNLFAQDIQFQRFNKSDGFPSDWIYSVRQDQQGFLWVGGLVGLSRYDGYNVKTYRHNPLDSTSLSNNYVNALYEDLDGSLWMGTIGGGLNLFDSGKETFIRYRHEPQNATTLSSDSVSVILQTRDGTIWVGTTRGLNRLDPDRGTFVRYTDGADDERTLPRNGVASLYEDHNGILWVGIGNTFEPTEQAGGLSRYDSTADNFVHVLPGPQKPLRDSRVTAIAGAPNGSLYVGTCQSGLYLYDPVGDTLQPLGDDPDDINQLRAPLGTKTSTIAAAVNVIHEDKSGMLWVATYSGGINRYDPATQTLTPFRYRAGDPTSLSSNNVLSFLEDRQGVVWVGTEGAGINKAIPSSSRFRLYAEETISTNNGVRGISVDREGIFWIGTFSGQLFRFDPGSGTLDRFSSTKPTPDGLWGNGVKCVLKDQEGMLWVGQDLGLYRIDPIRKNHRSFLADAANPDSLSHSSIQFIRQYDERYLWIGTWGGGLNRYDVKTERFQHFQHNPLDASSLRENKMLASYKDRQGILWFGTSGGGVNRFDEGTETFRTYLDGQSVFQIYEDRAGRFWVTTATDGLFLLNRDTGEAIQYTTEDGLPNNVVPGMIEDEQGLLWLATSGGVARFDPATETFITYDEDDGLDNHAIIPNVVAKSTNGIMFIGGPKGLTAINPRDFQPNPNPPVTAITGLRVFENAFPLPGNREEQITLQHTQNELTFDYVGLHFANPSRNRYAYRLEGYDKIWNNAGTTRRAKYTNLSAGTYTFKVKSSNSDGVWDEKGISLTVEILPPWWRTTVAYLIYGLLGITFVVGVDRFQRRRLTAKERERTRKLELEQAREALQQAALDRVRAEIASMRTAKDLERITPLIWRELTTLGVPFFRCGVFIIDEATEHAHVYLSTPSGQAVAALRLEFDSSTLVEQIAKHWQEQQVYHEEWDQAQFITWTQSLIEQGLIDSPQKYQAGEEPPDRLVLQFLPFTQGMLYVGSASPLSDDEIELTRTLADAFAVAYARYEDFRELETAKAEVEETLEHLKSTQDQLVQSEKMASLGQLTAGIAHEIKNPLNFVNNFSELAVELAEELLHELHGHSDKTIAEMRNVLDELLADLRANCDKINEHGKRADSIVKSMMLHARGGAGDRQPTDINALADEYLNLTYHGMRAKVPDFNVTMERDFDEDAGKVEMVPQEIGRVLLNLLGNAFDAVYERAGSDGEAYEPKVSVATRKREPGIEIRVSDNGTGISEDVRKKIFEPFFTTKPAGSGTGLGLSLSYDIITHGHGGTISVESAAGKGATFTITLPVSKRQSVA